MAWVHTEVITGKDTLQDDKEREAARDTGTIDHRGGWRIVRRQPQADDC